IVLPAPMDPRGLSLEEGQFPWDSRVLLPGIHLQSRLSIKAGIPPLDSKIELNNIAIRIYNPLTLNWLRAHIDYDIIIAYVGQVFIPSIQKSAFASVCALRVLNADHEMTLNGSFKETLKISRLLQIIAGDNINQRIINMMPDVIKNILEGIQIKDIAIKLLSTPRGYEIHYISFTVSTNLHWSVFEDVFAI